MGACAHSAQCCKTRVWNAAGEEAPGIAHLQAPWGEPVWTGSWSLPAAQQGLVVLGAALGSDAFVQHELRRKRGLHDELLSHLPGLPDLQGAWLLLLFCASPRANYLLRMLPPGVTDEFARGHDAGVQTCLTTLLSQGHVLPEPAQRALQLPLRFGGLGLRPAAASAPAAYWASWADSLPTIRARAPQAVERLLQGLRDDGQAVAAPRAAARHAAACLREQGFEAPDWQTVQRSTNSGAEREFGDPLQGRQQIAIKAGDERALEMHLFP